MQRLQRAIHNCNCNLKNFACTFNYELDINVYNFEKLLFSIVKELLELNITFLKLEKRRCLPHY